MKINGLKGSFQKKETKPGYEYWYYCVYNPMTKQMDTFYVGKSLKLFIGNPDQNENVMVNPDQDPPKVNHESNDPPRRGRKTNWEKNEFCMIVNRRDPRDAQS